MAVFINGKLTPARLQFLGGKLGSPLFQHTVKEAAAGRLRKFDLDLGEDLRVVHPVPKDKCPSLIVHI